MSSISARIARPPSTDPYGRRNMTMVGRNYKFQPGDLQNRNGHLQSWLPGQVKTIWCSWCPPEATYTAALLSSDLVSEDIQGSNGPRRFKVWSDVYAVGNSQRCADNAREVGKHLLDNMSDNAKVHMFRIGDTWKDLADPGVDAARRIEKAADINRMFLRELLMGKGSWMFLKDKDVGFVLEMLEDPEHSVVCLDCGTAAGSQDRPARPASLSHPSFLHCRLGRVLFRVPVALCARIGKNIRQSNRFLSDSEAAELEASSVATSLGGSSDTSNGGRQTKRHKSS